MHGRQPAAGPGAAARAEQLQGVRELGEVAGAVHAVRGGQGLPGAVAGREGAGVRGDHGPAAC